MKILSNMLDFVIICRAVMGLRICRYWWWWIWAWGKGFYFFQNFLNLIEYKQMLAKWISFKTRKLYQDWKKKCQFFSILAFLGQKVQITDQTCLWIDLCQKHYSWISTIPCSIAASAYVMRMCLSWNFLPTIPRTSSTQPESWWRISPSTQSICLWTNVIPIC